jgi:hypothetical protein
LKNDGKKRKAEGNLSRGEPPKLSKKNEEKKAGRQGAKYSSIMVSKTINIWH